jgi:nucleoside-diphosphate-sugar epimerase
MVYGPGDYQHRLYEYLKRMDDERPAILLDKGLAGWQSSFGYVENVAHAIHCAVLTTAAAHQVYNVADTGIFSMQEWVAHIARNTGWKGNIVCLPRSILPAHLDPGFNTAQHLDVSTDRIRSDLGYKDLIQFDTALARTVEWERLHPPDSIDADQYDYDAEDKALKDFEESTA